jgi:hypothetical protein
MKLKPFIANKYMVDVYRRQSDSVGLRFGWVKILAMPFLEEAEAQECFQLQSRPRHSSTWEYRAEIRPTNDRDHAEQRMEEILEAAQEEILEAMNSEMDIFGYDTWELGTPTYDKLASDWGANLADEISGLWEDCSPQAMGWVGSNGLP